MKGIILAAGMGTRLNEYTKDLPKGMLKVNGKTLINHQIKKMQNIGIEKIIIIKGYMPEKINYENITYYINKEYDNTNMVESLMCAADEFNDDCIVTYSDILFEEAILRSVLDSNFPIGVTVDFDFEDYWRSRLGSYFKEDMESLVIKNHKITSLGKSNPSENEIDGRYVGILKFSKEGLNKLHQVYTYSKMNNVVSKYGKRFPKKWYMTDLLQRMIDLEYEVSPIKISRGWLEFDRNEDVEKLESWIKNGDISNYINL